MTLSCNAWFSSNPQHTVIIEFTSKNHRTIYLGKPPGEYERGITNLYLSHSKSTIQNALAHMGEDSIIFVNNYTVSQSERNAVTNYPKIVDLTNNLSLLSHFAQSVLKIKK